MIHIVRVTTHEGMSVLYGPFDTREDAGNWSLIQREMLSPYTSWETLELNEPKGRVTPEQTREVFCAIGKDAKQP